MDFSNHTLNGKNANSFSKNLMQSKFIDLLNGGLSYKNAMEVLKKTFPELESIIVVPATILKSCGVNNITVDDWPSLAKELVKRN